MSQFTGFLRQITKKASHPNQLIYQTQLERARIKYLVKGELEDGKEGAMALGAPEGEEKKGAEGEVDRSENRGNERNEDMNDGEALWDVGDGKGEVRAEGSEAAISEESTGKVEKGNEEKREDGWS